MKILVTVPIFDQGGVMHFSKALLPYLNGADTVQRGKKKLNESKLFVGLRQIRAYIKFILYLSKNNYDAVLINSSISSYYCIGRDSIFTLISKLFKTKTVLFIHGYKLNTLKYKFVFTGFIGADRIVVLSEELKENIVQIGYKNKIYRILNPVDITLLESNTINKPNNTINLLFLARVEKEKGIIIALDAFKLAKNKYPNMIFFVAGNGNYLDAAKAYTTKNSIKNVEYFGHISGDKKIRLLQKSHILILPTYHGEGLPISILEAMVAGLSIISRPVGGIKDFFIDGKMGYLISSLDSTDFAKAIVKSIANIKTIRTYNKNYGKANFHPKMVVERLIDIMRDN